jgi:lysyl-tRNA synthetase class 2
MSPLAKLHRETPGLVERFEAFICSMEVANAFSELNDPREQRERFTRQREMHAAEIERAVAAGELPETDMIDDDFITAMEHGMPPAGGLGVGIDRLVMLLSDRQSIREVILFPQLKTRQGRGEE